MKASFDRSAPTTRRRGRVVVRTVLAAVLAFGPTTACIFDESDYKGGGHRNARTLVELEAGQEEEQDATTAPPDTGPADTGNDRGNPLLDAGGG